MYMETKEIYIDPAIYIVYRLKRRTNDKAGTEYVEVEFNGLETDPKVVEELRLSGNWCSVRIDRESSRITGSRLAVRTNKELQQ